MALSEEARILELEKLLELQRAAWQSLVDNSANPEWLRVWAKERVGEIDVGLPSSELFERKLLADAAISYARLAADRAAGIFEPDGPRSTACLEERLKDFTKRFKPFKNENWRHIRYT